MAFCFFNHSLCILKDLLQYRKLIAANQSSILFLMIWWQMDLLIIFNITIIKEMISKHQSYWFMKHCFFIFIASRHCDQIFITVIQSQKNLIIRHYNRQWPINPMPKSTKFMHLITIWRSRNLLMMSTLSNKLLKTGSVSLLLRQYRSIDPWIQMYLESKSHCMILCASEWECG
jgi:hypothetical protein